MQSMHQQYFPGQTSSSYSSGFGSPQYSQIMPPQGPGIVIANSTMASAQGAPKQNATGQKRKQVKNACVNCQKACKKCDEGRPCQRCVKYGLVETCQDSTRKERKKGIKRGPYKRRQPNSQSGSASASPSNVPLGNPMGTPQSSYSPMNGSPNMRAPMPFAYTPQNMNQFNQGYDTLNHPYGYTASYPKEHLIQGQFMFTGGNPVLSYNPSIVAQQQEILSRSVSPSPPLTTYAPNKTSTPMPHRSQTHTPTSASSPANVTSPNPNDNEEEEGSKLAILSQLCSTVLDNNDAPKTEEGDHNHSNASSAPSDQQRGAQNPQEHSQLSGFKRHIGLSTQTPPPSPHNAHSRTPSYDHDPSHQHNQSQGYHSGHNSPHSQQSPYTMNGHLSAPHRQGVTPNYTTPNPSPSSSPTDASFSISVNDSLKNAHTAASQPHSSQSSSGSPQHEFWPLPPLHSVVNPEHYHYGSNHYQSNNNSHAQSQSGQNEWGGIHVGGAW